MKDYVLDLPKEDIVNAITTNMKIVHNKIVRAIKYVSIDEDIQAQIINFAPYVLIDDDEEYYRSLPFNLEIDLDNYTEPSDSSTLSLSMAYLCIKLSYLHYEEADDVIETIKYMNNAANYLGEYQGCVNERESAALGRSTLAKKAATKKHAQTAAYKKK